MAQESPLLACFQSVVRTHAARTAIVDDAKSLDFRELGRGAERVAGALRGLGLAGCRVAILIEPGCAWVEVFFGVLFAGGSVVPLSTLHPDGEKRWFVEASRARALVVSAGLMPCAWAAGACRVISEHELREVAADPQAPVTIEPEGVALILYTSGTTGKPKGALLSRANVAAQAKLLENAWGFSADDRLLHALPLHHLHGIGVALLVSVLAGASTRFVPRFDAERIWEELGRSTVFMGVPTQHKKLIDAFDAADEATRRRWKKHARALRLITSGSAGLAPRLGERWRAIAGQYPLERYGMTEVGIALSNPLSGERRPGSCGAPMPGMQVRIVDETAGDVPPGEPGEIWIAGPTVFLGYDGDEAATRAAFDGQWFKSGDTATWLDDRFVQVLGRTSVDILKSGGYKVSAIEIEEALRGHKAIEDVAVVGIIDETWGDLVVAAVVARPGRGGELDESRLREWAKERLAPYKVPKRVVVLDALPRNPLGKVLKPELADTVARRLSRVLAQSC